MFTLTKVVGCMAALLFGLVSNLTMYQTCQKPKIIDCPHGQPYTPCKGRGTCSGPAKDFAPGLFGQSPSTTSDSSTGNQKLCYFTCTCKTSTDTGACICDSTTILASYWAKWDIEDCITPTPTGVEVEETGIE